jgi:hypothetical protein
MDEKAKIAKLAQTVRSLIPFAEAWEQVNRNEIDKNPGPRFAAAESARNAIKNAERVLSETDENA